MRARRGFHALAVAFGVTVAGRPRFGFRCRSPPAAVDGPVAGAAAGSASQASNAATIFGGGAERRWTAARIVVEA